MLQNMKKKLSISYLQLIIESLLLQYMEISIAMLSFIMNTSQSEIPQYVLELFIYVQCLNIITCSKVSKYQWNPFEINVLYRLDHIILSSVSAIAIKTRMWHKCLTYMYIMWLYNVMTLYGISCDSIMSWHLVNIGLHMIHDMCGWYRQ